MKKNALKILASAVAVIAVIYGLLLILRTSAPGPDGTADHASRPKSLMVEVLPGEMAPNQAVQHTRGIERRIPYSIVKRSSIGKTGYKLLISIAPEHANEADLTALGRMIKDRAYHDNFAYFQVFTSAKAAEMSDRLESLSEEEATFCYKSYVACYRKNSALGTEVMEIHPEGMNGPMKTIEP